MQFISCTGFSTAICLWVRRRFGSRGSEKTTGFLILLQIAFVKKGVAVRMLETFVVRDDDGNIIRVEHALAS